MGFAISAESVDGSSLEAQVSARWGPQQWDWTLGRTIRENGDVRNPDDHIWFWFCGTNFHQPPAPSGTSWRHEGYAETIMEALEAMLDPNLSDNE